MMSDGFRSKLSYGVASIRVSQESTKCQARVQVHRLLRRRLQQPLKRLLVALCWRSGSQQHGDQGKPASK